MKNLIRTRPTWGTIKANLRLLYLKLWVWRYEKPAKHMPAKPISDDSYNHWMFRDLRQIKFETNIHLTASEALDKLRDDYENSDYEI